MREIQNSATPMAVRKSVFSAMMKKPIMPYTMGGISVLLSFAMLKDSNKS